MSSENTETHETRLFIVDDHAIMREALTMLLGREPGFVVCGSAETGREALEKITDEGADLVLIDVSLKDMSGIEVAQQLRTRYPNLCLAILSGHGERAYVEKALEAGVDGYILKGDPDKIIAEIHTILDR